MTKVKVLSVISTLYNTVFSLLIIIAGVQIYLFMTDVESLYGQAGELIPDKINSDYDVLGAIFGGFLGAVAISLIVVLLGLLVFYLVFFLFPSVFGFISLLRIKRKSDYDTAKIMKTEAILKIIFNGAGLLFSLVMGIFSESVLILISLMLVLAAVEGLNIWQLVICSKKQSEIMRMWNMKNNQGYYYNNYMR